MKAAVRDRFGGPDAIEVREVDTPEIEDDGVLVRVRAACLNAIDWYTLTGTPWVARPMTGLRRPKDPWLGTDFAGTVEAVGAAVTHVQPGDDVFGATSTGACAEYAATRKAIARKPPALTFDDAAALPIAATTEGSSRDSTFSSTVPPEASARSPCRSQRRSERR